MATQHITLKSVAAVAAALVAIGGAIIMFRKDFSPWVEHEDYKEHMTTLGKSLENMVQELEDIEDRACENTLARIRSDLFRAQQNRFEAEQNNNAEFVLQSQQAIRVYEDQISKENRECGYQ